MGEETKNVAVCLRYIPSRDELGKENMLGLLDALREDVAGDVCKGFVIVASLGGLPGIEASGYEVVPLMGNVLLCEAVYLLEHGKTILLSDFGED